MRFLGPAEVVETLDYRSCIAAVREAMARLSADQVDQPLREVLTIGDRRFFGIMPGRLSGTDYFGAKLIGVFPDLSGGSGQRHRGVVVLFEGEGGAPVCVADAEEITTIRTAAMTAVAVEALARPDARRLAIFGGGTQARSHLDALTLVRNYERIVLWGRDFERAGRVAARMAAATNLPVEAVECAETAARMSDVIVTATSSSSPILRGAWLQPGTHVNLIGSSVAGPVEVDEALVIGSRFFVDSRRSALSQASELLAAIESGAVGPDHIAGEIGEVLLGTVPGRRSAGEITVFKSLGHIVQDLAAARFLLTGAAAPIVSIADLPRREKVKPR